MSSDRPRTPPRSTFANDSSYSYDSALPLASVLQDIDTTTATRREDYIPHVFDLITPSRDTPNLLTKHIPSVFLQAEAVDSSLLLGHGASFSASLQKIPSAPKRIEVTTHSDESSVTKSMPAPPRPEYVVYKIARVAFGDNGEPLPEYRRALQSVLTEYHALIYPPLYHHANIIDFLGLAWGSNPFSPIHKLPALIVEYAQHGTLADILGKNMPRDFKTKHILSLDIARGISAMHQAGIVHGDIKAENVLICAAKNRKYIAKIADFGFSVVETTEKAELWMGGTNPWKAPETKAPIPVKELYQTDIYSLGLLIWLICLDGKSPFDFILPATLPEAARPTEIESLKATDGLLEIAKTNDWFLRWLFTKIDIGVENTSTIHSFENLSKDYPGLREELFAKLHGTISLCPLIKSLDDIFEHALKLDPAERDLDVIVQLLESDLEEDDNNLGDKHGIRNSSDIEYGENQITMTITNHSSEVKHFTRTVEPDKSKDLVPRTSNLSTEKNTALQATETNTILPSWTLKGYKHRWISWQQMRSLDPSIQNFVFDSLTGSETSQLFPLCAFYLNGYGCTTSVIKSLETLEHAVAAKSLLAQAYMYRIFNACMNGDDDSVPKMQSPNESTMSSQTEPPGREYLEVFAKAGSRPAFEDLRKVSSVESMERVHRWITDVTGGVGATWFDNGEMLRGFTQSQWINDGWLMEQVKSSPNLPELIINKRGDTVLHFVAACGRLKPFRSLVVNFHMDINISNPLGETPLLCACRSGHGGIVIYCLQKYNANASMAAKNGETPLHWLISFDDQYIEPLTRDLLAKGASIDATTYERVCHSELPSTIDVDFQLPGTALSWAVHHNRPVIVKTLLEHGADPDPTDYHPGAIQSPMAWAAFYHHHECLRIIIEHLEGKVTRTTSDGNKDKRFALLYGPLVKAAVHAADKFSMILRNGADYMHRLHATLDLLREKTRLINFQSQFVGSLLHFAVSEAHDEVVNYMFTHEWRIETINLPCGAAGRTPVLEAVRWNRQPMFQMLVDHGADVHALSANPFRPHLCNWSALHVFANEGHTKDLSLVLDLVRRGVPVEGATNSTHQTEASNEISSLFSLSINEETTDVLPCESPFAVAIRRNAFHLASTLLSLGADPNATALSAGLFISPHPLTVLGHTIISNARYSSARLKYLLGLEEIRLVVEPVRHLTAIHRAAMANLDVKNVSGDEVKKEDFDMDTNADIMHELLLRWPESGVLDAKCAINGNTALHLAVEVGNVGTVTSLLRAGADASILNEDGKAALEVAEKLSGQSSEYARILRILR